VNTPTDLQRRGYVRPLTPLPQGLDAWTDRWIGRHRRRTSVQQRYRNLAESVDRLDPEFRDLTEDQLHEHLTSLKEELRRGGTTGRNALPRALAALRENASRRLGLHPVLEQLQGALALHDGCLIEMATGEGKTLTAVLTSILWAWSGRTCHVVTVNDYLVERDARGLAPLIRDCGLEVSWVTAPMPAEERRRAYAADITYVTSKEVAADFLRDGLRDAQGRPQRPQVLRGLHAALIDEADSVLIDEAVTPLILSAPKEHPGLSQTLLQARDIAASMTPETHYTVIQDRRELRLTRVGEREVETRCEGLSGIWRSPERREEWVRQALVAREFYRVGRQYVIIDRRIVIVDESTGRAMPERTWRQGLHQAIEAKEGLPLTPPNDTLARISFQRFFRLYGRLAGMSGTCLETADELWHAYRLPVIPIPTHRPSQRRLDADRILASSQDRWRAVLEEIQSVHATGRPILVGTRSVAASQELARCLERAGLGFQLLNALQHTEEAGVIARAGERDRITIATNMAGRGTDIRLDPEVVALGGLHVIATERHGSARVDRQLFGRSARQGDPGSAVAIVSLEDELPVQNLPRGVVTVMAAALGRRLPLAHTAALMGIRLAQWRSDREGRRRRDAVVRADQWIDEGLAFTGGGRVA
jgi:preprotein translocase subunit SecA